MANTIRMKREQDGKEADVHLDMVDEYRSGGFEFVDPPKPSPFDHDGDGQPGGSLPKAQRRQAKRKAKK